MEYNNQRLRHELKFYISYAEYTLLKARVSSILRPDENMEDPLGYHIRSLYFDDMFNTARDDKESGTRERKKYRIRIYNLSDKLIRFECKHKLNEFISKRSVSMERSEYDRVMQDDYDFMPGKGKPLYDEIYCKRKVRLLKPAVIVDYVREAYVADEGNVRLTFDKMLQTGVGELDVFSRDVVLKRLYPDDIMIFEVKYDDYLPDYIKKLIQMNAMHRCAISKYVMCRNDYRRLEYHD